MMFPENTGWVFIYILDMKKNNRSQKPVQPESKRKSNHKACETSGTTQKGQVVTSKKTAAPFECYYSTYSYPNFPGQMVPQNIPSEYTFEEFEYFVVIDFEATCDKEKIPHPQEIIEFPSVIVNSRTGQLEDSFQTYVRPSHNQLLTEFCTDLTGIQQSQVDEGVPLSEALAVHDKWLEDKGVKHTNFAVVTWSNWDCRVMLESECRFKKITKPSYFNRWINLKIPFGEVFGSSRCNLKEAVERAGLTWEGRAHCGLDDATNTARLLAHLIICGSKLSITNTITWESSDHPSGPLYYPVIPNQSAEVSSDLSWPQMLCYCGAVSMNYVLQMAGQPKGGFFLGCGNYTARGPTCNFFKWVPESGPVKVETYIYKLCSEEHSGRVGS